MEIDAILCDYAQAAENKLFVAGGGVSRSWVPPQPPHLISVGLAIVILVPYTATNQSHTLGLHLTDEDGEMVRPYALDGSEQPVVQLEMPFNLGRPPGISPGEVQTHQVAINVQLPLGKLGGYEFVISIDRTEVKRLPLRVAVPPQSPGIAFGPVTPGPIG